MDINPIFEEFSKAFIGTVKSDSDIASPSKIKRQKLDYSYESLNRIDEYLEYIFKHRENFDFLELNNTILWCGAYVGEVIKRNSKNKYKWIEYEEYMKDKKDLMKTIELNLGTRAMLVANDKMLLPVNKIIRYIEEGPGNSVVYFAKDQ